MRAVSAITVASKGGPDGGISSDEIRGAIQPIISTGMATPSQLNRDPPSVRRGRVQAGADRSRVARAPVGAGARRVLAQAASAMITLAGPASGLRSSGRQP